MKGILWWWWEMGECGEGFGGGEKEKEDPRMNKFKLRKLTIGSSGINPHCPIPNHSLHTSLEHLLSIRLPTNESTPSVIWIRPVFETEHSIFASCAASYDYQMHMNRTLKDSPANSRHHISDPTSECKLIPNSSGCLIVFPPCLPTTLTHSLSHAKSSIHEVKPIHHLLFRDADSHTVSRTAPHHITIPIAPPITSA